MRPYELTFIVRPTVEADALNAVVERVKSLVTNGGGQVTEVTPWGRRNLAYPVDKVTEGQYFLVRANLQAQAVGKLDRDLRLTEQVLRFLIVRADE
jgi:small subunit ribosomal protein S6